VAVDPRAQKKKSKTSQSASAEHLNRLPAAAAWVYGQQELL
jgi:hypothetical protein